MKLTKLQALTPFDPNQIVTGQDGGLHCRNAKLCVQLKTQFGAAAIMKCWVRTSEKLSLHGNHQTVKTGAVF